MKRKLILLSAALAVILSAIVTCMTVPKWETLCTDAVATVYHAVPAQCNADVTHTASMRCIDPDGDIAAYRILAMERTMMTQYGIRYGDVVMVSGAGDLDGLWTVEDTMNRRFAGEHKIDFLVPRERKGGKWTNVSVSARANRRHRHGQAATAWL